MNDPALQLLAGLADGEWHGGPVLSDALGVSRAAVWKQIEVLRGAGLPIESDAHRGYRLGRSIELLSADAIRDGLPPGIEVRVLERCASTNAELAGAGFTHRCAVLAEWQSDGRGRRGRHWVAPPGASIALSFGYRFEVGLPRLGALSLVAGIACAEALTGQGIGGLRLKWPNDLVVEDRKLGGLLVELQGAVDGPCDVVIGVGVNAWLPPEAAAARIDQAWTDLAAEGTGPDRRNATAAAMIAALDAACQRFESEGFAPFRARWTALDALHGRPVRVHAPDGSTLEGIAAGISDRGGLWLESEARSIELAAGEVSVRVG